MDTQERFWSKVNKQADNGCWEWTAGKSRGYGQFGIGPQSRKKVPAHRWAWEQVHGPIPEGYHIDHLCRNTACVNPDHLEAVTARENLLRSFQSNVQTHHTGVCKRGHEMTGENVLVYSDGNKRRCLVCVREWQNAHREQKRAYSRQWQAAHREQRNAYDRQRRALKAARSQS